MIGSKMDCQVRGSQRQVNHISASGASEYIGARIAHIGHIAASMLSDALDVRHRCADDIMATMQHVCTIGRGDFLMVSPDIVWLTEANAFEGIFSVVSNVAWEVE